MDGAIKLREIVPSDYEQWLPLWLGYNAFYGRSGSTALPPEVTQTTWQRFFDPREPVHAVVASIEASLVGLAHYVFHRSTTLVRPICYLQDLFTAPDRRRTGVARALIEEVYRRAQQAGSARIYWQTHESNAVARQLYDHVAERSGFIVYRKTLACEEADVSK